jgi:molybdopterin-containing oxidoreductase family iron-sulfur binding subunit
MNNNKVYWKSVDQLAQSETATTFAQNEFAEKIPTTEFLGDDKVMESQTSRRDFLKYLGFSTAAATLAACEQPIIESIPYVIQPESLTPGIPSYYASTYVDGEDYASILVKTREGRPIKINAGDDARFNNSTNARAQASVLSLYDSERLRNPQIDGSAISWPDVEADLMKSIEVSLASGKQFVLLTGSIFSQSFKSVLATLRDRYSNFSHVEMDAISSSEALDTWEMLTGQRALPLLDLSGTDLIVSVGDDFLSGNSVQHIGAAYAKRRKPGKGMLRHVQVESNLSLTGSNADKRIKIKPSEQGAVLGYLVNRTTGSAGLASEGNLSTALKAQLNDLAAEMRAAGANCLTLAGNNAKGHAHLAAAINSGSNAITMKPSYLRSGSDEKINNLMQAMKDGHVGSLIITGCNPVYSRPGFADAMSHVDHSLALCDRLDETASLCSVAAPVPHYLESWADYQPVSGELAMSQPTIQPLFDSKPAIEVLAHAAGISSSAKELSEATVVNTYGLGWSKTIHDGGANIKEGPALNADWRSRVHDGVADASKFANATASGEWELALYGNSVGAGFQSNNPWLHELPDPVTRVSWDNYLTMSAADAMKAGLVNETQSNGALNGSMVNVTLGDVTLNNVPVLIQPGQAAGSVGLAYGYGRTHAGRVANDMGINAYDLNLTAGFAAVSITAVEGEHEFASVQLGHTMMGRKIVNEVTLADYMNDASGESWNEKMTFHTLDGVKSTDEASLWTSHDHQTMNMWNMSIDLNSCVGCGACVVACHIENNVPVVGKEEIRNHRDMHWLRIDRYYSSDMDKEVATAEGLGGIEMYAKMEEPSSSPEVVFQPVMCQHCNNAPCETVCPVAATSHSREGLNHMAYNRCIGTRYCANNCPYKVRRFNWFNYIANDKFADVNPAQDDLGRMVLNPDVTVRSRGVMEKCSMCIQRIQFGKLEAKKQGRPIKDGEVTTACAQACESGAIIFGDVNDSSSAVLAAKKEARAYHLLDEIGTQPSVFYQTKVRNRA